jgi:alpha-L-rhamnosidase
MIDTRSEGRNIRGKNGDAFVAPSRKLKDRMTHSHAPTGVLVNGSDRAVGVGRASSAPRVAWTPDVAQKAFEVVVTASDGGELWRSSVVESTAPETLLSEAPLTSRSQYIVRVRLWRDGEGWSLWSAVVVFETGLLDSSDWLARWISRRVPAENRIVRSTGSDSVAWASAGMSLGQSIAIPGPFTSVSLDLTTAQGSGVRGHISVRTSAGALVASAPLPADTTIPWDRFMRFIDLGDPVDAGEYLVELVVEEGRVGWRTLSTAAQMADDDGVSATAVIGQAIRDGKPEAGVRAIGVETVPAPNPRLRRSFSIGSTVATARMYAVGLGYGVFEINDRAVSEYALEPAVTVYDRSVLYRTYDVTDLLQAGDNTVTASLGRGFYSARGGSVWGWNLAEPNKEPALLLQLEITYADGRTEMVVSDETWETAASHVASEVLYTGESFVIGSVEQEHWTSAVLAPAPGGTLKPATMPPVRRKEPVRAVSVTLEGGAVLHDFGVVLSGRLRGAVSGAAGDVITIRYGEYLASDGHVFCENFLIEGAAQTDTIVLDVSAEPFIWEPDFGYKGFRYCEVATTGSARIDDLAAIPLHTDVERVGTFACDEETLQWIDSATARTFLNNLQGVPTDTPVYEKNGWTADAHLVTEAALHHFDLRSTLTKWLDDHVDSQSDEGSIPQIVPTPGFGIAADPAWSASMALIPWNLFWEYGDRSILARYEGAVRRLADHLLSLTDDNLWLRHSWGDWLAPGFGFAPEGPTPTGSMMLHRVVTRTAQICRELGDDSDAEGYDAAARLIAEAYHLRYFDESAGHYRTEGIGYRQAMNVLPLAFGAVPPDHVRSVFSSLVNDIEARTEGHLDCGAIAVKYLFPVLTGMGRSDLAVTVATQQTRPGWGAWKRMGAQTLFESWDTSSRSHGHFFLGSVSGWLQDSVAGLRATAPGWETFDVTPIVDDRISEASITHRTVRGEASLAWRRDGGRFDVDLTVPPGARARVVVGSSKALTLPAGEHRFSRSAGEA